MTDFTKDSLEERLRLMETQVIPAFLHIPMYLGEHLQIIQKYVQGKTTDGLGAVNKQFFVQK
ncbi:hypothetical protein HY637_04750 [Candidatus Woesearchaeota archaeon]|nr:hypothetical protein [Candidatus Woesearchaeota archaeon]